MWIKSLDDDTWVSMKHVTHFHIEEVSVSLGFDGKKKKIVHYAYAYLDATMSSFDRDTLRNTQQDQARILICEGSREECREFLEKQQFLEGLFQWVGYLVAGGVGAVLTLIFT